MRYKLRLWLPLLLVSLFLTGCQPVYDPAITDNPWLCDDHRPIVAPPVDLPDLAAAPRPASPAVATVGRSVLGRPIQMYTFPGGPRTILIFGGIHGNEPTSVTVASNLVTAITNDPSMAAGRTVVILPNTNPDGIFAGTRTNANAVDVNRNFPASNWRLTQRNASFGGTRSASEPETLAIMSAIETVRPNVIVSIHSIARGRHGNNFDGPARRLAEILSSHNGYDVLPSMGYPTPGSFGTWSGIDRNIPTITLELPREDPGHVAWQQNRQALLSLIQQF